MDPRYHFDANPRIDPRTPAGCLVPEHDDDLESARPDYDEDGHANRTVFIIIAICAVLVMVLA